MRRIVCIVILLSMVLHCASRLGVLSFLYSNRHSIAYTVGLTADLPIAMCDSDYFADQALVVEHSDNDNEQMPVQFSSAKEIQLFSQIIDSNFPDTFSGTLLSHNTLCQVEIYLPPILAIFHPPC